MSPFFNSETGELHDEAAAADLAAEQDQAQQAGREARERIGLGPKPAAPPTDAGRPDAGLTLTREQMGDRWEAMRTRLIAEPGLKQDQAFMDEFATMGSGAQGIADAEGQRVLGEVFAGGQMRPPEADALSPAPRPELPDGHAWDEGALVLGEIEAHACGLAPHVVMQTTDELARAIEAAEACGVEWSPELGEAELIRRHGREGAQRMADHARIAYETIIESEHPLLVQRVKELARDYGDDPNVVAIFARLYQEITSGTPTPRLEALLLRRSERAMQSEAKAKAEAEQARRDQDAEGDEAVAARMAATALAHRRWGRQ